jgi:histone acetyltransferase (RNA polymerase elongator complex component)
MSIKHFSIPIFIPELACPNRCIYCDQQKISGINKEFSIEEIIQIIENHLKTIPDKDTEIEVGFFGGSFTGIPDEKQRIYLQSIQPYIKKGVIKSIRLSTRPDYIDSAKLNLLKKYHVKTIELGAQSLDDEVLKLSARGHSVADVKNASKLILENGFDLGLQMMIGLPGDTPEKSIETAKKIIEFGASNTRIYPTIVIKGTKLEHAFLKNEYKALSINETVGIIKEIIPLFEKSNVKIIRIGLHPSEALNGDAYVAGPLHPSIRELVETEIWKDMLLAYTKKTLNNDTISITVSPKAFNYAIGYQATNKRILEKYYKKVIFLKDNQLQKREFYVDTH